MDGLLARSARPRCALSLGIVDEISHAHREVVGPSVTPPRVFSQAAQAHPLQRRGYMSVELGRRGGFLRANLLQHFSRVGCGKRWTACQYLVEDNPQAVNIRIRTRLGAGVLKQFW